MADQITTTEKQLEKHTLGSLGSLRIAVVVLVKSPIQNRNLN